MQRGIRGATTVSDNSKESIKDSLVELINEIQIRNNLKVEDISHVIFTMTGDLDYIYPAKIVREEFLDWKYVPMMCLQELRIGGSLKMCVRVLVVVNTDVEQSEIRHVYLRGAKVLREDLK